MDISNVLAILGIAATTIIGTYSIYLVFRTYRYPGRITFVREICIGLFDSLVRNMPELSISYQDAPVGENLVLLKGFLLNTGTKDISPAMIEGPITITIPEGYRWLTAKVVSASSCVQANVNIENEQNVVFHTGLFRCSEYIRFEALAEVPENIKVDESKSEPAEIFSYVISFSHRIADTRQIEHHELQSDQQLSRLRRTLRLSVAQLVFFFIAICIIGIMMLIKGIPAEINYLLTFENSDEIEVQINPRLDGNIEVTALDSKFSETIPVDKFFKQKSLKPKIVMNHVILPFLISILILFLLMFLPIIYVLQQKQKDVALRRMLQKE